MKRTFVAAALAAVFASGPVRAQISVVSATVDEHAARSGESYTGTIRLRNTGAEPQEARLYPTDYRFFADGRTLYEPAGSQSRSNARWITLARSRVTVPAGGEAAVEYTVAVPAAIPGAGSYWSMVMVEGIGADSPEAAGRPGRVQMGVRPTIRYGIQLATHLAGGTSLADFRDVGVVSRPESGRALEFAIVNTGERAYRLDVSVELFDARGAPVGKLTAQRGLIYPGTSVRQSFALPALPPGSYQALVVADTGGDDVFGGQYTLRL